MSTRIAAAGLFVLLVVSVVAGAYIAFVSGGDEGIPRPTDGRYTNNRMRYTFEYPSDWADVSDQIKLSLPAGAKVKILDHVVVGSVEPEIGLLNGVQISVVQMSQTVDAGQLEAELQALDAIFQQQATTVKGTLSTPEWVELGGLKARQYVFDFTFGFGDRAASAQVVTFFGDRQYTVNCQGRFSSFDEKVLPGCEQVLQSFRFR